MCICHGCRVRSLGSLRQLQRAQNGGHGGAQKMVGRQGQSRILQVPLLAHHYWFCTEAALKCEKG